ncbi:hypothetical protein TTHERM_00046620 (macronuclear) [Tetrahymena thermophila SB210]|uniref:Uncharacterized protein n=1 Tax=Tetrahymena thermophila (strain SB210) TaxID=312017 RepID=Q23DM9_TETTS|nr:hypothetical protein TTHERM_00046620 [Tetrahymena thermophila SB210]EAR94446.2 hypothetical protein TTHERM_00046620 [Tetrahymena thermophila SB210]|eukprot:XP_001014657.2 hypothetical protein TTHERM_00046620 [Tetrahymena thermophila SB210]
MKNEILQSQVQKKRKIFIVKEKQFRKKSKTITSPTHNRARRNTEPVLSELGKIKRQIRLTQENSMRNQVPPYPSQIMRQRATSIPSSYQQYQPNYQHSGSFDQINSMHYPHNPIYSPHHQQQQAPQTSQSNNNNNISYPNHLLNQNSSSSSSTHLTSSSLTSPTQSGVPVYNPANQRNSQQPPYPYINPQTQTINGNSKNFVNSSTNSYQNNVKQQSFQQNPQIQYENNATKNQNNHTSPYIKQNNSCANSMSSSTNAPYSNSSQQDCDNSIYHEKVPAYNSSAPMIQKSNSWCAVDQRCPDQCNIYNEPPTFQHAQSTIVPPYTSHNDQYNAKYSSQYNPPSSNQYNYHAAYKANIYSKGSLYNNNQYNNGYSYPNNENQQIQNTPSTIASRTSQSPHNAGVIDSFEHGQNLYHQDNIEQGLQDFFIDTKLANDQENEDIYANSHNIPINNNNLVNNNYMDDLFDNKNCFDDDNDINNCMNQFNSSTNQQYNMLSSNFGDYNAYPEYS